MLLARRQKAQIRSVRAVISELSVAVLAMLTVSCCYTMGWLKSGHVLLEL